MRAKSKHHELRDLANDIGNLAVSMGVEVGDRLREIDHELGRAERLHHGHFRDLVMEALQRRLGSIAEAVRTEAQLRHAAGRPTRRQLVDPRD